MKKFLLILLISNISCAYGQGFNITPTLDLDNFKRGISPQVALMNRYGDYPVDLSNGLVDISIPLYTIQTPGITMPLQLKFHASGLRADEREGLLGIRWALAGGGFVSRIIKSYADDFYSFNNQAGSPNYLPDFNTLFGITGNRRENGLYSPGNNISFLSDTYFTSIVPNTGRSYKDTEYDIFSYSLPSGRSGKFILKDINGSKVPCTMPYEPVRISVISDSYGHFSSVSIIDDDGTTYWFGENGQYVDTDQDSWITTWHLSSVTSADKKDQVIIDYRRSSDIQHVWDRSLVVSDNLHDNSELNYMDGSINRSPLNYLVGPLLTEESNFFRINQNIINSTQYPPYYISSIQAISNGNSICNVNFDYQLNGSSLKYLQKMTVSDMDGNPIKTVDFVLKDNIGKTMKLLDKVEYTSIVNATDKEVYKFDYYDNYGVPTCDNLSNNSDWWGFYSAGGGYLRSVSGFGLYLPNFIISPNAQLNNLLYRDIPGGDKQSRAESMRIGMIQKIHYPTGGTTQFEYEANKCIIGDCGGLRISKITNEPVPGKFEIKRYEYEGGRLPDFLLPPGPGENLFSEIEMDFFDTEDDYLLGLSGYGKYIQRTYQNTFPSRFTDFRSNTVSYQQATEYIENAQGEDIGRTVYDYSISIPILEYYDSPIGYGEFLGYRGYRHAYVSPRNFWKGNHLNAKTIYQGPQKVKEFLYGYTSYNKESVFDMPVYRYRHHMIALHSIISGYSPNNDPKEINDRKEIFMIHPQLECSDCLSKTFAFKHQEYTIGADKLTSETENTYLPDGSKVSEIKTYEYDPNFLLPIKQTVTDSVGTVAVESKYPFHYANDPVKDEVYADMTAKNILTPVVEKNIYKNNILTEQGITTYREWTPNAYSPETFSYQQAGRSDGTELYYYFNSRNHLQEIVKNAYKREVYIRDLYNQPLAIIEQATYAEVEALLGTELIDRLADSYTISSTDMEALNQLRNQLPNAKVTTCSYAPLIGVAMVTDPKGVTVRYTYDGFNRLMKTQNDDSHILNTYQYKYSN